MTQEDKQLKRQLRMINNSFYGKTNIDTFKQHKELLLKDLCARLPYGVKIHTNSHNAVSPLQVIDIYEGTANGFFISRVKPYLRPMLSMTEDEKKEFIEQSGYEVEESINGRHYEYYLKDFVGTKENPTANIDSIDWLNAHHFDFRNLIESGLAIDCTGLNVYQYGRMERYCGL